MIGAYRGTPRPVPPRPIAPPPTPAPPATAVPPAVPSVREVKAPRWNISRPVLAVLEQVFTLEKFPSQLMRQRLAADLSVTPRQVRRPPSEGGEG